MENKVPAMLPEEKRDEYVKNYELATKGTGRLFLFAGDQKIEHLNKDFFGKGIPACCADPEHLFKIASKANIGAFATQLGLISLYGCDYKDVPYIVKLNSKTDFISKDQADPVSLMLHSVGDVVQFKYQTNLPIVGVGYTIYLGSEHEPEMLAQAADVVYQAHENGLLAVLWIYPRGKAVADERDPDVIAGAAGVAACLGADFVKVNPSSDLKQAVAAAGRTKVICSGGPKKDDALFLQELAAQVAAGAQGCAVGRNIYQREVEEAVAFCDKIGEVLSK